MGTAVGFGGEAVDEDGLGEGKTAGSLGAKEVIGSTINGSD